MATPLNLPWNDKDYQIDYGSRTDGQPVYHGFAVAGSKNEDSVWTIYKFTYNASGNATRRQIVYKKDWTNRASHF